MAQMSKSQQKRVETQTAVVPRKSTAVGLPAEWAQELAQAAKDVSAVETPSISNVSFRAGVLSIGGQPMPGNELECIVIDTAFERSLYDGPFDPNRIKNPICFALKEAVKEDDAGMAPHENSLYPQHEQCNGCAMNEWGSAGEGRRGKACKEVRRLALIPADKLGSAADIRGAELAMAKIPVTSVSNWSNYVHSVSAQFNVPYWAVVTKVRVAPHIKNQFEVLFEVSDTIEDIEALEALKVKRGLTKPFVMAPYSRATEEGAPAENMHPHTQQVPPKKPVAAVLRGKDAASAATQTQRPPIKGKKF